MKPFYIFITPLLILSAVITGCEQKQQLEPVQEVRPVKTIVVQAPDAGGIRQFPGRVDASRKAVLSFRVDGKVQELLVKEGDLVKKGDVIAKLDPTDFQITVNDKKATFTRTQKDYLRGKVLVKDGNISKMDFDRLEASFLSARADLNLAAQQLEYTELKAPFDGTIARRYIQSFEEVQAKQDIVTLNDNAILELKMNIPENLILGIQRQEGISTIEESRAKYQIPVTASFQTQKDKEFKLSFKEIATKADEKTQTFEVTYVMPRPENLIVLPGMTASVKIDLTEFMSQDDVFYLPVSAVVADVKLQGTVWVVNEQTMEVQPKSVKVGTMKGGFIQVKEGLQEGQRIVVAGVPFLYEGLKVTLMKQREQARDNLEHKRPVKNQPQQNTAKEG